jgi:GT2 family glycosyltransferase
MSDNWKLPMLVRSAVDCSIVVPFHSNRNLFEACIHTLRKTIPAATELVVVANNARPEPLPELPSDVRVLKFDEDLGYSRAANIGAEAAQGKTLILCDADTFYFGDWFRLLLDAHRNASAPDLTGSRLLNPATGRIIDFGHAFTDYNFARLDLDRRASDDQFLEDRDVQTVCAANAAIERRVFLDLGGFDASLYNFYSDVDFCLRLRERGGVARAAGRSIVYHRGDSALNHRAVYYADVKGKFMAANAGRLRPDMKPELERRLERFVRDHRPASSHLLVDASSVIDRHWYREAIGRHLPIIDTYEYRMETRDAPAIDLLQKLGLSVAMLRVPVVYFVDRFLSLRDNEVWCRIRPCEHDVVVDRHGTIARFPDVVAGII